MYKGMKIPTKKKTINQTRTVKKKKSVAKRKRGKPAGRKGVRKSKVARSRIPWSISYIVGTPNHA